MFKKSAKFILSPTVLGVLVGFLLLFLFFTPFAYGQAPTYLNLIDSFETYTLSEDLSSENAIWDIFVGDSLIVTDDSASHGGQSVGFNEPDPIIGTASHSNETTFSELGVDSIYDGNGGVFSLVLGANGDAEAVWSIKDVNANNIKCSVHVQAHDIAVKVHNASINMLPYPGDWVYSTIRYGDETALGTGCEYEISVRNTVTGKYVSYSTTTASYVSAGSPTGVSMLGRFDPGSAYFDEFTWDEPRAIPEYDGGVGEVDLVNGFLSNKLCPYDHDTIRCSIRIQYPESYYGDSVGLYYADDINQENVLATTTLTDDIFVGQDTAYSTLFIPEDEHPESAEVTQYRVDNDTKDESYYLYVTWYSVSEGAAGDLFNNPIFDDDPAVICEDVATTTIMGGFHCAFLRAGHYFLVPEPESVQSIQDDIQFVSEQFPFSVITSVKNVYDFDEGDIATTTYAIDSADFGAGQFDFGDISLDARSAGDDFSIGSVFSFFYEFMDLVAYGILFMYFFALLLRFSTLTIKNDATPKGKP